VWDTVHTKLSVYVQGKQHYYANYGNWLNEFQDIHIYTHTYTHTHTHTHVFCTS
jgi:hypothetical protein